ncbi:MAG TPA: hypothetical protein VFJ82_19140 [Longimicrobium sp.]|nr:hypothetical protein [Longimicrobium sp.]
MTDAERDDDAGGDGWSDPDASGGGDESAGGGQDDGGQDGSGGGGVKLPRHDFVTKLVKDPSNLADEDGIVMLNGFAGDSDEEGYTRLYCEPTLEHYTDVKDEDILHYEEDAMVGYRVWARRNAQVRHGSRGQGKGESGSFFSGPLLADYGGGHGTGGQGTGGQGTGGQGAGGQAEVHDTVIGPTGWRYCTRLTCPPTQHQECTWICPLPSTTRCLPASFECPPPKQGGGGAQAADTAKVGPTGWQGCTQPGHCVGQTGWQGCTQALGCPSSSTCPPQQGGGGGAPGAAQGGGGPIGVTGWLGCTHMLGCPSTSTCPPQGGGGAEAFAAAPGGGQSTAATLCTQVGCHPIGITGWYGCHTPTHTLATVCTQIGCGQTHLLGCPSTSTCPPQGGGGAADAAQGGGQSTAATLCTQVGCHPIGITGWYGCHTPTHTLATVCTQIGCGQMHLLGCPSTSTCPPQGGGAEAFAAAPGGGQSTAATLCTQIGCIHPTTWTQIGCGPGPVIPQGGGQSTAATVCTQIGCGHTHLLGCGPRTSDCPPTYMPGCPSTSTCPPQGGGAQALAAAPGGGQSTAATLCTQIGCEPTAATFCFICPPRTVDCPVAAAQGGAQGAALPGPNTYGPACTLGFTCTYVGCPGGAQQQQSTAATVCTQLGCGHTQMPGCPGTSTCPPHGTAATVCTQVGCPGTGPHTYGPGCTLGFTCTYVGCPR